jgi:putative spermidine/putrescine transport system substrate-binding protein
MQDHSGLQLGNYRVIRLLGRGGFAAVYLGEHRYLKTQVAIKILQTKVTNTGELESFLKEAQTIAHLVHPHIVRILDFGVNEETPFLVMDYAPHGTLRQRHPKGVSVSVTTLVPYVKQIAAALQHAHDKRIIHRDVKPENMLLGGNNEVLLGDFGIALVAQSSHYQSTQDVAGTITYMSPEQIQGKPRAASDQYSLGIVSYEWLCGDRPFHGSFAELCTQHLFASPPSLREKLPTIAPDVERVIMTALAKDPRQRFGSIDAFANALEQASKPVKPVVFTPKPVEPPQDMRPSQTPFQASVPLQTPHLSKSLRSIEQPQRTYTRRTFVLGGAGALALGAGLIWYSSSHNGAASSTTGSGSTSRTISGSNGTSTVNLAGPIDMQTLIAEAKKEGKLEAIGIPPEWADYKDILAGYAAKYVPVEYQAEAEFSSLQELDAFTQSKQHPHGDIADVGFKFGPMALQQGLITPYKHSQWADIPEALKDLDGNWCTEYWGTQAFVINTDIVKNIPTSFKDLLAGDYKNMIGIDGDPRQANDAFMAVYSAALATSGKLDDIESGINFFNQLKAKGNFTLARTNQANFSNGSVAIGIMWDYLGLGFRDALQGKPNLSVIIPSDGSIAGPYVSLINKTAPNPYAARLWIEYIFSDEGQLFFLKGYAHPARYQKLVDAGKIPPDLAAKLPAAAQYSDVRFVTDTNQFNAAIDTLNANWQVQVLGS